MSAFGVSMLNSRHCYRQSGPRGMDSYSLTAGATVEEYGGFGIGETHRVRRYRGRRFNDCSLLVAWIEAGGETARRSRRFSDFGCAQRT
jgi:hypothetical protein